MIKAFDVSKHKKVENNAFFNVFWVTFVCLPLNLGLGVIVHVMKNQFVVTDDDAKGKFVTSRSAESEEEEPEELLGHAVQSENVFEVAGHSDDMDAVEEEEEDENDEDEDVDELLEYLFEE